MEQPPQLPPVTPGELLQCEFLDPLGLSQYRLSKEIGVPASRICEILSGQRAITADTDLRLCRFLGLTPGYWLRAQAAHDTEIAKVELAAELDRIEPLLRR
jgi:addiction module HigA family antidote